MRPVGRLPIVGSIGAARITSGAEVGVLLVGVTASVLLLAAIWSRPGGRTALRAVLSFAILGMAAAGSAGVLRVGGPAPSASPPPAGGGRTARATCSPRGRVLRLSARGISFDTDCLAAPAGERFVIEFRNDDQGVPHNVAIYTDPSAGQQLFGGPIVQGPGSRSYHVPSLEPGTYYFRCDVHPPQMNGAFVVE